MGLTFEIAIGSAIGVLCGGWILQLLKPCRKDRDYAFDRPKILS